MATGVRRKIRYNAERMAECCNTQLQHLAEIGRLSEGRSEPYNKSVAVLIEWIETGKKLFESFRDEL